MVSDLVVSARSHVVQTCTPGTCRTAAHNSVILPGWRPRLLCRLRAFKPYSGAATASRARPSWRTGKRRRSAAIIHSTRCRSRCSARIILHPASRLITRHCLSALGDPAIDLGAALAEHHKEVLGLTPIRGL